MRKQLTCSRAGDSHGDLSRAADLGKAAKSSSDTAEARSVCTRSGRLLEGEPRRRPTPAAASGSRSGLHAGGHRWAQWRLTGPEPTAAGGLKARGLGGLRGRSFKCGGCAHVGDDEALARSRRSVGVDPGPARPSAELLERREYDETAKATDRGSSGSADTGRGTWEASTTVFPGAVNWASGYTSGTCCGARLPPHAGSGCG